MKMQSQDIAETKLKANSHRKRRCSTLLVGIMLLFKVGMIASEAPEIKDAYSQPLTTMGGQPRNDDNTFRPILPIDISPEFISRNVFTKTGQYRVFQPAETESDLRLTVAMRRRNFKHPSQASPKEKHQSSQVSEVIKAKNDVRNSTASLDAELKGLEDLLVEYVEQFFSQGKYEPTPGLVLALQQNHSSPQHPKNARRSARSLLEDTNVELNIPRAFGSARLLFFSGLKKVMWPIYMGLQVLKSVLLAMFLPTIIGSVSRLIGKGITSGSAGSVPLFIRPMEPPQELDFRDNSMNFDDDSKFSLADDGKTQPGYEYNAEASQQQTQYAQVNGNSLSQATLSRYGGQQMMQDTYLSALQSIGAASFKNSQSLSGSSSSLGGVGGAAPGMTKKPAPAVMNTFQSFQKVPSSSLLLSNYDPFYSPLLSRLDSVFGQLKLNPENEACRQKLICLMYANPAKYAPYSNLVSAQLSRELNELRKPTSDNPDILRFFKYMRAAKDGQDGIDCDQSFAKCTELKDFENPAMLSTYNDINKLVQARKLA
ncbi:uncharacterized protein Dana_GF16374, isoform B [Drosophila ananassae]|uniref:Uncharacterized protein, isoform A n=1 Tax=Drosophila ananassae TaxID=7217 RepID=B3LVV6_DROAN|nr:uncharacterized protein LOC6499170 [Drosophila ananassae]XP_014765936.1 uncharacterized protein LOC6499170 [Drosophila ananassae]XP_032309503.1 uncharacterized protein LOC6499170 [Drosophila ananassae]XP_044570888.1 uncharacterized protein LOC6499170 [Drosophila ananassae]EDV43730.1 uncharacterized protein Dana_GF16374, isoform A [Drosophila ananassae]KPU80436.1 uncharacterized protein Dana_GF16374, isoform B [Drosophila ananassae]